MIVPHGSRADVLSHQMQVGKEFGAQLEPLIWGRRAKNCGRVIGGNRQWAPFRGKKVASLLCDPKGRTKECLSGSGSEADDDARLHDPNLRFPPRSAGCDFARAGFLVQSPRLVKAARKAARTRAAHGK